MDHFFPLIFFSCVLYVTVADIIPVFLFRFADFVDGSFHLMPNEVSVHAQEYGLGALLFDTDDEDNKVELTEEEEDDDDNDWTRVSQQCLRHLQRLVKRSD